MRKHGTRAKYQAEGCRCNPCTTANNIYALRRKETRRRSANECDKELRSMFRVPADAQRSQFGVGVDRTGSDIMAGWRQDAACAGRNPMLWDIDSHPAAWRAAAIVCAECPVRQQCHNDHINNPDAFGIYAGQPLWAGMPLERKTA